MDQLHPTPNLQSPPTHGHPPALWIGIGCQRGVSRQLIEYGIQQIFQLHHLAEKAIAGIATIDLKANEEGLVEFCRDRNFPLRCFSAEQLRSVLVPNPSAIVAAEAATPSVAEAAAILAATRPPTSDSRPPTPLLVPKQIIHRNGEPGAVTLAVAQAVASSEIEQLIQNRESEYGLKAFHTFKPSLQSIQLRTTWYYGVWLWSSQVVNSSD